MTTSKLQAVYYVLLCLAVFWPNISTSVAETTPAALAPSVDACSFVDAGLAEACNPTALAASLIPAHRHALVAAAVDALRHGKKVDQAYLRLPAYLPNLSRQAQTILDKIPPNVTTLDKVELAMLAPRVISECLQPNAGCALGSRAVATAIAEAMRKVANDTANNITGDGCVSNSSAICLKLLPSAVETTIELGQWGPVLVQFFQRNNDVCAGNADVTFDEPCVAAILSDFEHIASTWVFGQALSQANTLTCLDKETRKDIRDFQTRLWPRVTERVHVNVQDSLTGPTFLAVPDVALELLNLSVQSIALIGRLRQSPVECFKEALDLKKNLPKSRPSGCKTESFRLCNCQFTIQIIATGAGIGALE